MIEFDSIGTHWWIELLDGSSNEPAITRELIALADRFDQLYSRFREDSLISQLRSEGTLHNPPEELVRMLDFAKELSTVSDGAFCLSIGNPLHAHGYGNRQLGGTVLTNEWQNIYYSHENIAVPKGTVLDLGGFGKGWLIDELAVALRRLGVTHYVINGGGDIYVQSQEPLEFALENPYDPTKKYGQTRITQGALAGSSTLKRSWNDQGASYHHIFDPDTNLPSRSSVVASYVRAESARIADSLATIVLLRPQLANQLAEHYAAQVILIPANT